MSQNALYFEYVALNGSELLLPEKRAEHQELKLPH